NGDNEQCDDGANSDDTDQCYDSCLFTYCGDGTLQQPNGEGTNEECDAPNYGVYGDGSNQCTAYDNQFESGDLLCSGTCNIDTSSCVLPEECIDYDQDSWSAEGSGNCCGTSGTDECFSGVDCVDDDSSINPGATEVCSDTIDQDCSGEDLACDSCTLGEEITGRCLCEGNPEETGFCCSEGWQDTACDLCELISADWGQTTAYEYEEVSLSVETRHCIGYTLDLQMFETGLPHSPAQDSPEEVPITEDVTTSSWTAEWDEDFSDPATFRFEAIIMENGLSMESDNLDVSSMPLPVITLESPEENTLLPGSAINFACRAESEIATIQELLLYTNLSGTWEIIYATASDTLSFDIEGEEGVYAWNCEALDEYDRTVSHQPSWIFSVPPPEAFTFSEIIITPTLFDRATIEWTTTYPTNATVFWGDAPGIYDNSLEESEYRTTHSHEIQNLEASTEYYVSIKGATPYQVENESEEQMFTSSDRYAWFSDEFVQERQPITNHLRVNISTLIMTLGEGEQIVEVPKPSLVDMGDFLIDEEGIIKIPDDLGSTLSWYANLDVPARLYLTIPAPSLAVDTESWDENTTMYSVDITVSSSNPLHDVLANGTFSEVNVSFWNLFWHNESKWDDVTLNYGLQATNHSFIFSGFNLSTQDFLLQGTYVCTESWECTDWNGDNCGDRTCIDVNHCGTNFDKPSEHKDCASGGGGGSGGSGGGGGYEPLAPLTEPPPELILFSHDEDFTKNIEHVEIEYLATEELPVDIRVEEAHPTIPPPAGFLYKFFEIDVGELSITQGKVSFAVPIAWFSENRVEEDSITLQHYNKYSDEWEPLPTEKTDESYSLLTGAVIGTNNRCGFLGWKCLYARIAPLTARNSVGKSAFFPPDKFIYYQAKAYDFSLFAITGEGLGPVIEEPSPLPQIPAGNEPLPEERPTIPWLLLIIISLAVLSASGFTVGLSLNRHEAGIEKQIGAYITHGLQNGRTESELTEQLIQRGWPADAIDHYLSKHGIRHNPELDPLRTFIRECEARGARKIDIRNALVAKGWNSTIVDQFLET
ncbi:MAG: PGF-pre-PGF domain-containing protein, partial [Nanoarchaeota archaeon]